MPIDIGEFSPPRPPEKDGVVFELAGEKFTTLGEIPGAVMNDFLVAISVDERGRRKYSLPNLLNFLTGILREEEGLTPEEAADRGIVQEPDADGLVWVPTDDVERLERVVYGKRHVVQIDELGELVMALGKALGKDRTPRSGRSAPGR